MKRVSKNRLGTFVPRLETLEHRWQPGSILTSGLDLSVLGSALDQNLGTTDGSSVQNQALSLSLGSFHTNQNNGGSVTVAPYQVTHSSTGSSSSLTMTSGSSDLGLQNNQAMAVASKHLGTSQGATQSTGTGQSSTINLNQQGSQQTVQNGLTAAATPIQAAPVSAAVPTSVGTHSVDLKLTSQTVSTNQHPPYTGFWASFASNPASAGFDSAALYKVVQVGGGAGATLYAVGQATDASGAQDIFLVATAAGSTSATVATIGSANPGNAAGYSIALDSSGNNLIIGGTVTDSNGNTAGVVASVTTDLSAINWNFGFAGPSAINGVTDANSTVYYTGNLLDANGQMDIVLGSSDEAGNIGFAYYYTFSLGASSGNAVAIDTNGVINVAGQLIGDAATLQAPSDGSSLGGHYFLSPGTATAVNTDALGNSYYSGSYQDPASGVAADLEVKWDPTQSTTIYGYYIVFSLGGVPGNSPANDAKIDPAGDNLQLMTFDDNSGNPNTHGQLYFETDPTGAVQVDIGGFGGSNDDYGNGLATDGAGNVYTVGSTNSPDFPSTGFQQTYSAGDPSEGWIAYATTP